MPSIRILPPDLRNKIAAGEVIERPASVAKELMENAIDAGSSDIRIEVLYGGKRLIKVSDNGTGMDREDALLCFERHATSKLTSESDLFNIRTMGFRGEALPSIASVSKLKIITGIKGSPTGVSIEISGGEVKEIKDAPAFGTAVEVRDLFFNTPARKKFMKSNSTELLHIIDSVTREALSHWEIGFSLFSDNKETMAIPRSSGMRERILQVYDDEFLAGLIEVNAETTGIRLKAFASRSENFRNMKSHQFIFINRRPVRDQSITHAVYSAYEGIMPREKHPVFFLFLDIDPVKIDVNVHPTKREVRFENKTMIHGFVQSSMREALKEERAEYTKQFTGISGTALPETTVKSYLPPPPLISSDSLQIAENLDLGYTTYTPSIYLGDTFIALPGRGGLTLIDHHAAHERILYERFLKGVHLHSHQLLFPKQIQLSTKEYRVLLENISILGDFGIALENFGHDTVLIRSLPSVLKEADIRGILSDVASCILEGIPPDKSLKEALSARIACHSSVRGSDILSREEITRLVSDLEKTAYPDQCPHGRPTRIFLSLYDLRKMFKRK